jgi:DNA-binding Lrp family transcriptional regulator
MVTAVILLNVNRDRVNEVAEALADLDSISEVYSVSGRWDLIALMKADNNEKVAELVTVTLRGIQGIEKTETMIAFRAYSNRELDSGFSLGYE